MDQANNEEGRIRQTYARRDAAGKTALYAWDRLDRAYRAYRHQVAWIRAFKEAGFRDLSSLEILDVGCGDGGWLRMMAEWGADPGRLHGLDLLEDRIARAKALSPPALDLRVDNAMGLDFPNGSMDVCVASTVFSSILSPAARLALAQEMVRVVRPAGALMIFDFAVSHPRNPDTIGIGKKEIIRLFPDLRLRQVFKLILPPPLLRLLPTNLLWLANLLEVLFPPFCTHRLYLLTS